MRTLATNDGTESTVTLDVIARLRGDIVDGKFAPGMKLRFADLRDAYCVGMGTLREALSRLVPEGLVTLDAGRGFSVAAVSIDDLLDIKSLRVEFERRAIVDSVRNGDEEWETRVLTTFHRLSTVSRQPPEERLKRHSDWIQRHRDFHAALVSACRSQRVLQFRAILFDQAERYRILSIRHRPRLQDKHQEHEEIKTACLARDADLAGDLIVRHIDGTVDNVLKYSPQFRANSRKAAPAESRAGASATLEPV
jgi:GntR family transcriptional regulator, carbon starvation induced regulator